jgi:hypothetical protein
MPCFGMMGLYTMAAESSTDDGAWLDCVMRAALQ